MRDVVLEWCIPYVMPGGKRLLKAVLLASMAVLCVDTILYPILFLPVLAFLVVGILLLRSWKYEYEYVYVNGDFTISKIIRKAKRKDVYHTTRLDMEDFVRGRAGQTEGNRIKDFTSGRPNALVYTIKAKGEYVYIEPSEEFVDEMKKYYSSSGI